MGSELQEMAGLDWVKDAWHKEGTTVCRRSRISSSISFRSLTRTSSGGQNCPVVLFTLPGRMKGRSVPCWLADSEARARVARMTVNNIVFFLWN